MSGANPEHPNGARLPASGAGITVRSTTKGLTVEVPRQGRTSSLRGCCEEQGTATPNIARSHSAVPSVVRCDKQPVPYAGSEINEARRSNEGESAGFSC